MSQLLVLNILFAILIAAFLIFGIIFFLKNIRK